MSQEHIDKIAAAHRGLVRSETAREHMSIAARKSCEAGRRPHLLRRETRYTKLAHALHAHLSIGGLELTPEVRFGRFTVDLYDPERRVAYEADGEYWHDRAEKDSPGCAERRDLYLFERHGVRVIHFTERDIKALAKECAA